MTLLLYIYAAANYFFITKCMREQVFHLCSGSKREPGVIVYVMGCQQLSNPNNESNGRREGEPQLDSLIEYLDPPSSYLLVIASDRYIIRQVLIFISSRNHDGLQRDHSCQSERLDKSIG